MVFGTRECHTVLPRKRGRAQVQSVPTAYFEFHLNNPYPFTYKMLIIYLNEFQRHQMWKLVNGHALQHQIVRFRFRPEQHDQEKRSDENEQYVLWQLRLRLPGDTERHTLSAQHFGHMVHRRGTLCYDIRNVAVRRYDV